MSSWPMLLGDGWLEADRRRTRARVQLFVRSARLTARMADALGGCGCCNDSLALDEHAASSMIE